MILPILYCFLFIVLAYLYAYLKKDIIRKLPLGAKEAPIERGLPIIGTLYKMEKPIYDYLRKLGVKHGPIFRMNMGMREVFVLCDYKAVKMCLKDDSENFSGRWNGKLMQLIIKSCGIMLIDGEKWARHRAFMLRILRDFGLGRSRTDEIVQKECSEMLVDIGDKQRQSVDFSDIITHRTLNIIAAFLMKKQFGKEDAERNFLVAFINKLLSKQNMLQLFHMLVPQWDNSALCTKISYKLFFRSSAFNRINDMFEKEIEEHLKLLDVSSEGQDYMDKYLLEQSRLREKEGSIGSFTNYQLVRSSFELFAAGYHSTTLTVTWSLFLLSKNPQTQSKMHSEITDLIGTNKIPSSNDKKSLPFTQAVMDEILRVSSAAPLSVFHRNFHDTVINDIFIPKNSFIIPNLYSCHRDTAVWEKPFEFNPDHFLSFSDDGTLKYRPREELIPFGIGKRQCLGESLARAEYFIFLASIIQRFHVSLAENISEETFQEIILGDDSPTRHCKIKNFIFEPYANVNNPDHT